MYKIILRAVCNGNDVTIPMNNYPTPNAALTGYQMFQKNFEGNIASFTFERTEDGKTLDGTRVLQVLTEVENDSDKVRQNGARSSASFNTTVKQLLGPIPITPKTKPTRKTPPTPGNIAEAFDKKLKDTVTAYIVPGSGIGSKAVQDAVDNVEPVMAMGPMESKTTPTTDTTKPTTTTTTPTAKTTKVKTKSTSRKIRI